MNLIKTSSLALALTLGLGTASAFATEGAGPFNDPVYSSGKSAKLLGDFTSADNARLAAVIYYDAANGGTQVLRSVGVAGARSPSNGLYCIRPSTSAIPSGEVQFVVPAITVNFSRSLGTGLEAFYRQTTSCLSNEIAVYTLKFNGTSFAPSRQVGFNIIVP